MIKMIIKCTSLLPNEEQAKKLGKTFQSGKQNFWLEIGKEYVVYGLRILQGSIWVELVSDTNYLYSVPLCLFEVVDKKVSKYWEIGLRKNNIYFWPNSFYKEYYHDDLFEGVPEVLENFLRIKSLIDKEAKGLKQNDKRNRNFPKKRN